MFSLSSTKADIINAHKKKASLTTLTPLKGLLFYSILFQVLYYVIDTCYIYNVSRRMANLLYVIWVSAYNCTFLLGFKLVENFVWGDVDAVEVVYSGDLDKKEDPEEIAKVEARVTQEAKELSEKTVPNSLTALNNNSLVIFLIANLFTGLTNMNINTLDCTTWQAVTILIVYESSLAGISLLLQRYGIKLR
ncbi:unnamed protein product [Ambrosiozyma monospora]|uniref:Unnamed protein product n=1 Tax=Ambrosiozyma monospora TaxID=43982 RepID=A0ACB5TZF0_AMBMO|nr:unnamed protein product [Ambrosiozyma monospora]